MSREEAFQALRDGDFRIAIPLLEHAIREAGFSSDAINQAYTQALFRAGEKTRLANAAFEIADSFVETDPAVAMDYFQRAFLGDLDAACIRHVGEIFEQWAAPKKKLAGRRGKLTKVAHVVGCVNGDHAPARNALLLSRSLRRQGIDSRIFTTEWATSWFLNSEGMALSQPAESRDDVVIGPVRGNFLERAESIATSIRAWGAQAVFYHAGLSEQITARVAAFRPAPIQVNVVHDVEMDPALFDGYIFLRRQSLTSSRHASEIAECIPPSSDIADRFSTLPENLRQLMALDAAETVSATLGNLESASDPRFLDMLTSVLTAFPAHFHLFAGSGDVKTIRAHLHAEGVLARVRFMGSMSESASVMALSDLYLAPFDDADAEGALVEAMGAGKPAVVLGKSDGDLLGIPKLVARNEIDYRQVVQRLVSQPSERKRYSERVLSRFREELAPEFLGPRYMEFLTRCR